MFVHFHNVVRVNRILRFRVVDTRYVTWQSSVLASGCYQPVLPVASYNKTNLSLVRRAVEQQRSSNRAIVEIIFCTRSSGEHSLASPRGCANLHCANCDRSPLKLKDVQQNDLVISGQKTVPMLVGPTGGRRAMEATAAFRVAEVRDNILSLGKLFRNGFSFSFGPGGCSMEKDGRKVTLYLERNSLRVETHVLERPSRPGYVAAGTAVTDERMVWTS